MVRAVHETQEESI